MKLGVFSVSTPEWEPIEVLEKLAKIGYQGVEWRVIEDKGDRSKPTFWSGNLNSMTADELIAKADELKAKAKEVNIEMPAIGAYVNCYDMDGVELHMKACKAVGAKSLRINVPKYDPQEGTYPEQMKKAKAAYAEVAKRAADIGVKALAETHMSQLGPSTHKVRELLDGLNPEHVGIMWDPGNMVKEGLEVYQMSYEIAGEYLSEVHVKNQAWKPAGEENGWTKWNCSAAPVNQGIADWPAIINLLKEKNYDGWLFFEDFSTEIPTEERVTKNLEWFKGLIG